jgi:hypothetical protein
LSLKPSGNVAAQFNGGTIVRGSPTILATAPRRRQAAHTARRANPRFVVSSLRRL